MYLVMGNKKIFLKEDMEGKPLTSIRSLLIRPLPKDHTNGYLQQKSHQPNLRVCSRE